MELLSLTSRVKECFKKANTSLPENKKGDCYLDTGSRGGESAIHTNGENSV